MPNALITGINGQDGAYLAHLLLSRGYKVWGTMRYSSWCAGRASTTLEALADFFLASKLVFRPPVVGLRGFRGVACAWRMGVPSPSVARKFSAVLRQARNLCSMVL